MPTTTLTTHTRRPLRLGVLTLISVVCAWAFIGCKAETNSGGEDAATSDAQTSDDTTQTQEDAADADDVADTNTGTLCDVYCATAAEVCTGDNLLYPDAVACQRACSGMKQGTAGEATGNTLQCRIFHLELGRVDPHHHCPHASESGADKCIYPNEARCRSYCGSAMENCLNANGLFPSADACLDACFTILDAGVAGDEVGNTVECRVTHAEAAAADPSTHCPAAAVEGSTLCINP
jgi:hypothetical protein